MKSAIIPTDDGGKVFAWTCRGTGNCKGGCARTFRSEGHGAAEDIALAHAARHGVDHGSVHTVIAGRGRTFKTWRGARGWEAREVL